jgi:hypothetical protein
MEKRREGGRKKNREKGQYTGIIGENKKEDQKKWNIKR